MHWVTISAMRELPHPRSGRRLLSPKLSVRVLLLAVTTACCWLGYQAHRAHLQTRAVKWVNGHGGSVYYDWQRQGPNDFDADIKSPVSPWLREWIGAEYFQRVVAVSLSYAKIQDVSELARLEYVEAVELTGTSVRDLSPLSGLGRLRRLDLDQSSVTDLTPLKECRAWKNFTFRKPKSVTWRQ